MWVYLFSQNESYPDPVTEIRALVELAVLGGEGFLKLSSRDDAPLKGARAGEFVFLCTRTEGRWVVHAEAKLAGEVFRGPTPESVAAIYGMTGDRHWWRGLTKVREFDPPMSPAALDLDERSLPRSGQAHVVRIGKVARTSSGPLQSGTDVVDRTGPGQNGRTEDGIRTVSESSEDVIIDYQGRIFRLTGEQITRPGHEPEFILRSLAAAAAGKVVSLDELRARRS